jgi:hypothetical protein
VVWLFRVGKPRRSRGGKDFRFSKVLEHYSFRSDCWEADLATLSSGRTLSTGDSLTARLKLFLPEVQTRVAFICCVIASLTACGSDSPATAPTGDSWLTSDSLGRDWTETEIATTGPSALELDCVDTPPADDAESRELSAETRQTGVAQTIGTFSSDATADEWLATFTSDAFACHDGVQVTPIDLADAAQPATTRSLMLTFEADPTGDAQAVSAHQAGSTITVLVVTAPTPQAALDALELAHRSLPAAPDQ